MAQRPHFTYYSSNTGITNGDLNLCKTGVTHFGPKWDVLYFSTRYITWEKGTNQRQKKMAVSSNAAHQISTNATSNTI